MNQIVKGSFRAGVPVGVKRDLKIGGVLPKETVEQIANEQESRLRFNISDPSSVRPFVDQPVIEGTFPLDLKERQVVLSKLIHEYRNGNPNVIHAVGILAPDATNTDDIAYLTNMYFKCQEAFITMISQIKEQGVLPHTPKLDALVWENIAFPRLANNLHLLKAAALYIESENESLIVHVLLIYSRGKAAVFSTRVEI